MMKTKYWIFLLLCLPFFSTIATAQAWEKTFVESGQPTIGNSVVQTTDGGYIGVGNWFLTPGSIPFAIKVDANGTEQWRYNIGGKKIINTRDGNYLIADEYIYQSPMSPVTLDTMTFSLRKIDEQGNILWAKGYDFDKKILVDGFGSTAQAGLTSLKGTQDGGYVFVVYTNDSTLVTKVDSQGIQAWSNKISNNARMWDIIESSTGELICVGEEYSSMASGLSCSLVKMDSQGEVLWEKNSIGNTLQLNLFCIVESNGSYIVGGKEVDPFNPGGFRPVLYKLDTSGVKQLWGQISTQSFNSPYTDAIVSSIAIATNGDFLITGSDQNSNYIGFIARVNAAGQTIRATTLNDNNYTYGREIKATTNGGCVVIGSNNLGLYLTATDSTLQIPSCIIEGNVYNDLDLDCIKGSNESNLKNWIVELTGGVQGIQQTIYTTTDTLGNYTFQVDTGQHTIAINTAPYSAYWEACQDTQVVNIHQYFQIDTVDFALHSLFSCPLLQVDISTPLLRRCFSSNYYVNYTNLGGSTAQNAYVEVELDSFLIYNSSTIPLISQVGQIYRFDIGNVSAGEEGNFSINVTADCNNTILGQTHCVEAHIYPDTICIPNYWNGPIITAEAICLGDSIQFNLRNTGSLMPTSAGYIVTEDNIMLKNSTYQLGAGAQISIYQTTQAGATYRIIADQTAGFPVLLGDPFVTASVEGCKPFVNGSFSTGFITNMSNGNASPFVAVDCQQNIGAYDPNDKQAQPVGYDLDHYISEETALDYHIRFQNTGTDTAFTVRVVDTLSEYLDLSTIEVGASSHPYTWKLFGNNRIEFTFNNIMLPDSNVNEPASHGFVKFRIQQKAGNATGTRIENTAAIYFDFNAPVLTNTTWHTIGNNFIISNIESIDNDNIAQKIETIVAPNPMSNSATIQLKGMEANVVATLSVFDALGQQVEQLQSTTGVFQLVNKGWSTGMYIYKIQVDQELIGTGKIMVK